MRLIVAVALLVFIAPGQALAAWHEAASAHFVVYADDSEKNVRTFSERLERYHRALEVVTSGKIAKKAAPSPSNRVTVFVVGSVGKVQDLAGGKDRNLAGFYISRAGGSVAIVPRVSTARGEFGGLEFSMIVLLHEYAHHFMISNSPWAMPKWVSEGGAEFFASASFENDGGVGVGRPAQHRAGDLFFARDVTAAKLLDPEQYERRRSKSGMDAFYGKAWLLYHYLTLGGKRDGQLRQYLQAVIKGKSSREAGLEVFGPFDKLESELDSYLRQSKVKMLKLPAAMLDIAPVAVRRLGEGEAAMMPVKIRSRRGVTKEMADELVVDARKIASRYPDDAAVLTALAEAEYDSGHDAEAISAADRALAIDPRRPNAYVQKGYAMFRQASHSDTSDAFVKARAPFVALNRIENDNPLALVYYYRSYLQSGAKPPKLAVDGLFRAMELAPFDHGLRMTAAMQELRDGFPDRARMHLSVVAANPHGGKLAEIAQTAIDRLAADPAWRGEGLAGNANALEDEPDGPD